MITLLATALTVAAAATAAQAIAVFGDLTTVTVTPARGTPTTTFRVRFKTPFATDPSRGLRTWEVASVVDRGQPSASCTSTTDQRVRPAVANQRVSVTLTGAAKPWCAGPYAGTITLYRAIVCGPGPIPARMACPEIVFAPEPIGHFRFTVAAS